MNVSVSPLSALAALACSVQAQTVTCPLNEFQNGGTSGQATITLTVIASGAPQQIVNTAFASTVLPQTDSNTTNKSARVSVPRNEGRAYLRRCECDRMPLLCES